MYPADEVNRAMGTWLALTPWDVFATWTFSKPVRLNGAMYWARRHLAQLEVMMNGYVEARPSRRNAWGYVRESEPELDFPRKRLYAFVAVEKGDSGGLLHLHSLIGNVRDLKPFCGDILRPGEWGKDCCMLHAWPCGIARVMPYNPKLGASFYVSKYVTKGLAEWDLVGPFPCPPGRG